MLSGLLFMKIYCVTCLLPTFATLGSSGNSVVMGRPEVMSVCPVKVSDAVSVVAPSKVTNWFTWFTAGVLLIWKIASRGLPKIPVVAGTEGMVHLTRPVLGSYVGVLDGTVLVAPPVNKLPDCMEADTVTLDRSVA